jgi:hypothetical protein
MEPRRGWLMTVRTVVLLAVVALRALQLRQLFESTTMTLLAGQRRVRFVIEWQVAREAPGCD